MHFKLPAFFLILILFFAGCSRPEYASENSIASIKKVLASQAESWNKGDLEGYMQGYWKSDSLKFIGKSGLNYGWNKTLQNYKKSYPDPEAMGKLNFTILSVESLSHESAFVIGKWHLTRTKGNLEGHFTLLFRKINNTWKIVADHSS